MNFNQSKFQENIKLRSEYRKIRHHLWTNGIEDKQEVEKCNLIKRKILNLESNPSKKFYRYKNFCDWDTKRLEAEIDCIINNKLTFVAPSLFNDPYDCRPPIKLIKDFLVAKNSDQVEQYRLRKKARKAIKETLDSLNIVSSCKIPHKKEQHRLADYTLQKNKERSRDIKFSEERINSIRKKIPIICFASKENDMYFWSHYGGTHKGFCIEYEFGDDLFDKYLHPVEYIESWPSDFNKITNVCNASMILIKSIDWVQELEWRMSIKHNESCDKEVLTIDHPRGLKISAIYLGLDFFNSGNEKIKARLMESFKEKKVFQMTLENDSYRMRGQLI